MTTDMTTDSKAMDMQRRAILVINPNASTATTAMMVKIAAEDPSCDFEVLGATASRGPQMIVNAQELAAAGLEVERSWIAERDAHAAAGKAWAGVIVSAFGVPGLERVRTLASVPVVGICEASMLEAAQGGRRFGIATVTPELVEAIDGRAEHLGLAHLYTGIRLTEGDPRELAADPQALEEALAQTVKRCIEDDGAQAVIIGGGPLGQAALALAPRFDVPVIAPIAAAVRRLAALLDGPDTGGATDPKATLAAT
ncbi:MAG: aspartate/glutamate racemase family protein [Burkholderiaceae bacterium]